MTDQERITKLEERLAAAEARIAQLEKTPAPIPLDLFRFGGRPMPQPGDFPSPITITCAVGIDDRTR